MEELTGRIIIKGTFSGGVCKEGILTITEDGFQFECPKSANLKSHKKWEGVKRFGTYRRKRSKGIVIDTYRFRVDNPEEWIEALKKALAASGMKFERTETYRVI
jgi:hypothetical protein